MSSDIAIQKAMETNIQSLLTMPDQMGLLVLNESGGVISSYGDLSNDEQAANALMGMVKTAWKVHLGPRSKKKSDKTNVAKLSIIFDDYWYSATVSSGYVYVIKRRSPEPVV